MSEIDYQLALLLQHQYNEESKAPDPSKADQELAKHLHEQFQTESQIETTGKTLSYSPNRKKHKPPPDPTKSLVDPSWEIVDPTPDIHTLFMAFDERFFGNQLDAVCVSWSKRMTTCAGVCSYQGRHGLCSITLSEPLLKLRPRKDLVETLLHEMIHALLFVTNNNKDRDGHGPEFHKHMYRINAEAGTNISVYHDFHDEVKLYQQHWWKCNGPCQNWKPFFGMVKRAMNRPPGPSDRWFGEHARTCMGTFVKVKEPEKVVKQKKSSEKKGKVVKTGGDIRKFFPTKDGIENNQNATNKIGNIVDQGKPIQNKSSNIHGFNDVTGKKAKGGTGIKSNGGGTVVVTLKDIKNHPVPSTSSAKPKQFQVFTGESNSLPSTSKTDEYSAVRNHWVSKYGNKRPAKIDLTHSSPETKKASIDISEAKSTCPVCNEKVAAEDLNSHLDECLLEKFDPKSCIICDKVFDKKDFASHVKKCSEGRMCPICGTIVQDDYDLHAEECLMKMYDEMEEDLKQLKNKEEKTDCLACGNSIVKSELSLHLNNCLGLSRVFDE